MTTSTRSPAAAWAAAHRTLLVLAALAAALVVAAVATLSALRADDRAVPRPQTTEAPAPPADETPADDPCALPALMTVVLTGPFC